MRAVVRAAALVVAVVAATGCREASRSGLSDNGGQVRDLETVAHAWVTTADQQQLLRAMPVAVMSRAQRVALPTDSIVTIVLDTTAVFQSMVGFGAALTDASVEVLQRMRSAERRTRLLEELFSPDVGIGLGFVRFTIGASDFSPDHYTFDDTPGNARDTLLAAFSIAREQRAKLPLLRRLRAINPAITFMATPWSAPAWMKMPATLYGGTLRADAMPWYAAYLVRALAAYQADSVPVGFLSVQNEPQHAPTDYPGMMLSSAQRAELVGRHLGPLLAASQTHNMDGATKDTLLPTRILEWDHNWDAPESPLAVLADTIAKRFVHGVAWHCYAGDVSAQSAVHERHPTVATYFTECSGGDWATNWGDNLLWNTRTLIIGATRNWARGVMLWNVALDESHGPHRGGCTNCRGVVTVQRGTDSVTRNEEYYALAHASRFIKPGAVRIGSTGALPLEHVAFRDSTAAVIVLVVNADATARTTAITGGPEMVLLTLPPRSVVTVRIATTPPGSPHDE